MSIAGAVLLAAVVLFGASGVYLVYRTERSSWEGRETEAARDGAARAGEFIEETRDILALVGSIDRSLLSSQSPLLNGVLAAHPDLLEIARLDGDGHALVGVAREEPVLGKQAALAPPEWFRIAQTGGAFAGDVLATPTSGPTLIIAVSAPDHGVVAARARTDVLSDVVSQIRFGPSGSAFIADRTGEVLAVSNEGAAGASELIAGGSELEKLIQSPEASWSQSVVGLRGEEEMAAVAPVAGTNWVVVTEIAHRDAFSATRSALVLIVILVLVFGSAEEWLLARSLDAHVFRPMKRLQEGVERVGRGELDQRIEVEAWDELGRVAAAFNQMATRLRDEREALQQRSAALEELYRVSVGLTSSLDLQAVLDGVLHSIFRLIPRIKDVHVFFYRDGALTFAASLWTDGRENYQIAQPRPEGLTYRVARSGEVVIVPDIRADPLYAGAPDRWRGALVSIPLKVSERVVGVMNVAYAEPHAVPEVEQHILRLLGDQVAIAIENARLFGQAQQELVDRKRAEQALQAANDDLEMRVAERTAEVSTANKRLSLQLAELRWAEQTLRRSTQRLEAVREIDRAILAARSTDEIAAAALRSIRGLVPYARASIVLFESDKGTAYYLAVDSPAAIGLPRGSVVPLESIGDVQALRDSEGVHLLDLSEYAGGSPVLSHLAAEGMRSVLSVPLQAEGELIGELRLCATQATVFDSEHQEIAYEVGNELAVALHQARLRAGLASEQQRLHSLVEQLPDGVALLDRDQRIILANPTAQTCLSRLGSRGTVGPLAELGGRPLDSFLVDPAAPAWHDLSVDGGQPGTYEVAARRLEGDAGSEGWVLQLRDVTRERAASVHLQQQERLAAVGQLAAGIAHDFNNIMTAIILFAEKLLMEPGLPPAGPERLNLIVQQGKRAAALIQQILDFSRQSVIEKQPLELVPFMKELDKLLTRILPEHIRLRLSFEPGRYLIHADPARIQQVFMNLAVNARDAMPDGGSLEFALSHYSLGPGLRSPFPGMPEGDWVHIGVTDEGTGIRSEDLPHIFEPFFTTKAPGKGAGLGLAQVYGIVKQHNGYIMATSEAGKGTAFNLYFPGLPVEAPAETSPTPMTLEAGNGETILVVEDDPATRASVSEILRSLNYRVLVASDGQAALRVFHGERQLIDLVLSDVVMPGMGGMQLFRALADQKPEQKILAMTGYPLVEGTKELLGTGTVAWLQKPLGAATLAHTVREVLDGTKP